MWCHYFAVATGTTISCSLGRQYGPVFSPSFLDVYDTAPEVRVIKQKYTAFRLFYLFKVPGPYSQLFIFKEIHKWAELASVFSVTGAYSLA
jgi:hypothetical protein